MTQTNYPNWTSGADFAKNYYDPRWFGRFEGVPRTTDQATNQLAVSGLLPAATAAPGLGSLAYKNLADLLINNGKTDPIVLNRNLADISRTSQGQQQDWEGMLAGLGLGGSGVGQSIGAAIGQGGAERRAGAIATDTAAAEARKQQILQLFTDMITNPAVAVSGHQMTPKGPSGTEQAAQIALMVALGLATK